MSNILEVHNVSKQYRLGTVGTGTLSHDLNRWFHKIRGKEDPYLKIGSANDRSAKADSDYVWALQDISFNVKEGEVLGIIGKNGAGKSTLLKILSRVTGPTTGSIKAYGRIASLLEVGTGFHPELTGRENIYLNGAILGMSKAEIRSKFDEIVDFSGCERYIDTPVKRYSSGMYVRLAFAVAAHLEPEILIVDEVLAVGDAEFQKKALGKMKSVSQGEGRTILFVSHNMTAVKSICKNGIILEHGNVKEIGSIDPIVSSYLKADNAIANHKLWKIPTICTKAFQLLEMGVRKKDGDYSDFMRVDNELEIIVKYRLLDDMNCLHLTLHFKDEAGNKIFSDSIALNTDYEYIHPKGDYITAILIPAKFFNWGSFSIDLYVVENRAKAFIIEDDIVSFTLVNSEVGIGGYMGREPGEITPHFNWKENYITNII